MNFAPLSIPKICKELCEEEFRRIRLSQAMQLQSASDFCHEFIEGMKQASQTLQMKANIHWLADKLNKIDAEINNLETQEAAISFILAKLNVLNFEHSSKKTNTNQEQS